MQVNCQPITKTPKYLLGIFNPYEWPMPDLKRIPCNIYIQHHYEGFMIIHYTWWQWWNPGGGLYSRVLLTLLARSSNNITLPRLPWDLRLPTHRVQEEQTQWSKHRDPALISHLHVHTHTSTQQGFTHMWGLPSLCLSMDQQGVLIAHIPVKIHNHFNHRTWHL